MFIEHIGILVDYKMNLELDNSLLFLNHIFNIFFQSTAF